LIIADKEPFFLNKPVINIGRRSSNDLVLDDPMVSRDHIQLRAESGRFYLFDLGSKAGTTINNFPASNIALKPGDVIQIGQTRMIFNQWIDHNVSKPTRTLFGGTK
jgi:pSer/pThr/pTyr-binding forkhead associated (FHA) protein